jgi:VanZ family protein
MKVVSRIILFVAVAAIVYASVYSAPSGLSISTMGQSDKWGHLVAYWALTLAAYFGFRPSPTRHISLLIIAVAVLGLGFLLEALQCLIPNRSGWELGDMIMNAGGVFIGVLSLAPLLGLFSPSETKS